MSAKSTNVEQRLSAMYAVEPAGSFVNRLEKDLLSGNVRARRLPVRTEMRLVWAAAAVIVLLGAMLATPQGRAFAQEILHFFTRATGDSLPAPVVPTLRWVEHIPGVAAVTLTPLPPDGPAFHAQCGDFTDPHCTVAQIRGLVDFTVRELGSLPAGMYFIGATGGPGDVWLIYKSGDNSRVISLHEQPWTGSPEQVGWQVGASAVVESVQVGDIPAEYVKGSFTMMAGDAEVVWDPDFPTQTLHWVEGDVFYELQVFYPSGRMDQAAFITLAASLTTEPVVAALTPMPTSTPDAGPFDPYTDWTLTPAQAGALAGFTVHEPSRLPEILSYRGAIYDADHHLVSIYYPDTRVWGQGGQDGLTLSQQPIPPENCEICGFVVGSLDQVGSYSSYTVVGETADIRTVQIGDVTGQYVEGAWYSADDTPMQWHNDGYMKVLRWQAGGMAYELTFFGMDIEQADMIAIAESLK